MKNKKRLAIILIITTLTLFTRFFLGIFVIQPIGAIPEGATIVYWRSGLNLPFIASADGLLEKSSGGVSLLGRGLFLSKIADPIKEREFFRFGYSKSIYLWSTRGKTYSR